MTSVVAKYLSDIAIKYSRENSTEYSYRTEFEEFLKAVFSSIGVNRFDHDAKAENGNKPDFAVVKNKVPILYIEVKDIGVSLDKVEKSEQMARYYGYANLILTDYLEFRFYRNGIPYEIPIKIATLDKKQRKITPIELNFEKLSNKLVDFSQSFKEPIKSGEHLAKIMGGKAQRIRDNIRENLYDGSVNSKETLRVFNSIKKLLVHDLDTKSFSDMYAQTVVYGLFVARYYDKSQDNFTRQEARDLIPNSNPFLRHFFDHIVGPDFDDRLILVVNELCEIFSYSDVEKLMTDFYKRSSKSLTTNDPVIHFYEDFLEEYDPILRRTMGAYYTPTPVVRFISQSLDLILKNEFGLADGLADVTKLADGKNHRVQILDPAVGTGTFISGIIREIYKKFKGQEGRWPKYVHNDLLPRIHGFEIMMAPYTIAHLKLGMAFKETGFKYFNNRLGIYLTNSLENIDVENGLYADFGLANSIAQESKEAQKIKNNSPIMVVVGNPPYNVSSNNKSKWIQDLIDIYKQNLNEKKINLDDDYIKFIRYAEHFIEKNKTGVLAYITNNSFIDGLTHRQMRKHLLETFDQIYVLDLHGSTKKRETTPDGKKDENIFKIQQGVSISIFIRTTINKSSLGKIYHSEIFGTKKDKLKILETNTISTISWKEVPVKNPYYFFIPKNMENELEYCNGFAIDKLMPEYNSGIQTKNDKLSIQLSSKNIESVINDFKLLSDQELKQKYELKDTSGWNVKDAKADIMSGEFEFEKILYRPFDSRFTVFTKKSGGFIGRPREKTSFHFANHQNLGLITVRQQSTFDFQHALVTKNMIESGAISLQTKEWGYIFPLYIYDENGGKVPNFNGEIIAKIEAITGKVSPEAIFDYIYAVLYSPKFRLKFKELLKIDFPKIPYPIDVNQFNLMSDFGRKLRTLHIVESSVPDVFVTTFPEIGTDLVDGPPVFKDGNIYINDNQYFGNVSDLMWNFYIGGYQPARKWLKDRIGQTLSGEDIIHYQKILFILAETDKIMKQIDAVT